MAFANTSWIRTAKEGITQFSRLSTSQEKDLLCSGTLMIVNSKAFKLLKDKDQRIVNHRLKKNGMLK